MCDYFGILSCVLFSDNDCAEGPANVRRTLQQGGGKFQSLTQKPLPGFFEMCRCKYRIITNWASFFSQLDFENCTQSLHIPYMVPSALPADILVIFRPTRDTLA